MRHWTVLFVVLGVVSTLSLTGCEQQVQKETQKESSLTMATIQADCIVHYFKTNGSAYITRQQHECNPETGFFRATATEPIGKIQCTLNRDNFTSTGQKKVALSDLPDSFWNKNLATVLFYSFCAGGNLLDTSGMQAGENVKIEGQWYRPFKPAWPTDTDVTLLQSLYTERIELVELKDSQDDSKWLVECYNHRCSKELEERIPRTIDVYDIRDGIASKALMIRFDYKDIQKINISKELK